MFAWMRVMNACIKEIFGKLDFSKGIVALSFYSSTIPILPDLLAILLSKGSYNTST
jgi:hypothetical protein